MRAWLRSTARLNAALRSLLPCTDAQGEGGGGWIGG